jgi:nitric oxide reductase NorD protein
VPRARLLRPLRRAAARLTRLVRHLPRLPWPRPRAVVELDAVRRRLELLLAAMYGRTIPIAPAEVPPVSWWMRGVRAVSPFQRMSLPASDGESLRLPASIDASGGMAAALARYRILAVEQGERIARGTSVQALEARDALERDLFLLRESASIDAAIARASHGFVPALAAARAHALTQRPPMEGLAGAERDVEHLVRSLLSAAPASPPTELQTTESAADSLIWARSTAARLRSASTERYRGVPPVDLWGNVLSPSAAALDALDTGEQGSSLLKSRVFNLVQLDMDAAGGRASDAGGGGKEAEAAQRASEQPSSGDRGSEVELDPIDEASRVAGDASGAWSAGAAGDQPEPLTRDDVIYPEWDHIAARYRPAAVIVRRRAAREHEQSWAVNMLREHAGLVRRVRERFERLRARRARLLQQRDGEDLDLAACVRALVDERTGHSIDDRLYVAVRPARREMAILLLVDVSGSTDVQVTNAHQIIDVEKIALLLAGEALDALGDRYAMLTFSGTGASNVRLTTIKDFAERNGATVRRRISALAPEGNTRLGAAIRHATAQLDAQRAGHRLLLILSDGKPNDVGGYQGAFGVEDSRQAINEARAAGVYPFCLTVDREEPAYLQRIFGRAGYAILPHPDQLPLALVRVVKHLLDS